MTKAERPPAESEGWHQQDILAAIRKKGATLASLERQHGYRPQVIRTIFYKRWPKGQRLVAEFIGVPVEEIWPRWYGAGGVVLPLQGGVQNAGR